jgi:hypothetical protein
VSNLFSHRGVENVKVLLENSVSVEGDLLVLDFSLAMEKVTCRGRWVEGGGRGRRECINSGLHQFSFFDILYTAVFTVYW